MRFPHALSALGAYRGGLVLTPLRDYSTPLRDGEGIRASYGCDWRNCAIECDVLYQDQGEREDCYRRCRDAC